MDVVGWDKCYAAMHAIMQREKRCENILQKIVLMHLTQMALSTAFQASFLLQTPSYLTETVLSNNITCNSLVLSFLDSDVKLESTQKRRVIEEMSSWVASIASHRFTKMSFVLPLINCNSP